MIGIDNLFICGNSITLSCCYWCSWCVQDQNFPSCLLSLLHVLFGQDDLFLQLSQQMENVLNLFLTLLWKVCNRWPIGLLYLMVKFNWLMFIAKLRRRILQTTSFVLSSIPGQFTSEIDGMRRRFGGVSDSFLWCGRGCTKIIDLYINSIYNC